MSEGTPIARQRINIQNHLGSALHQLGVREDGTERLLEAVACYSELLTDETRKNAPFDWALNAGLQGVTYMLIAERRDDPRIAHTAETRISMALEVLRGGDQKGFPLHQIVEQLTTNFDEQLPKARALSDRLSNR